MAKSRSESSLFPLLREEGQGLPAKAWQAGEL